MSWKQRQTHMRRILNVRRGKHFPTSGTERPWRLCEARASDLLLMSLHAWIKRFFMSLAMYGLPFEMCLSWAEGLCSSLRYGKEKTLMCSRTPALTRWVRATPIYIIQSQGIFLVLYRHLCLLFLYLGILKIHADKSNCRCGRDHSSRES